MRIINTLFCLLFCLFEGLSVCGCAESSTATVGSASTTQPSAESQPSASATSSADSATAMLVEVVEARAESIPDRCTFVGRISGNYEAVIQPRVSGYLLSRHFESGMPVKRGALLFEIDAGLLRTTLLSARASLESARAQAVEAKNNYERAIPLAEINAISQAQLDQYTAQYRAAEASVRSAEQQLRNASLEVGYSRIYSPIDGFVEAPKAHVGDYVGVGTEFATLTKVVNIDTVSVDITLPLWQYERHIEPGRPIYENESLLSDIVLFDDNGTPYPLRGTYNYTRTEVSDSAGTLAIVVDFPNPDYRLKAGEFARVEANVGAEQRCLLVPQRCVVQRQGQASVWVVRPDSTAEYRRVSLGETYGGQWIVEEGLREGEQVVTSGGQRLRNGVKVAIRKAE